MAEEAKPGPLTIGQIFQKNYKIISLIGQGGHACVYHATHVFISDRHVAIKVLHRVGGVSDDMLRRGQAEAQILNKVQHPNIVEVIDAGMTEDGQLFIIMELLRGRPLRDALIEHGRLDVHEVLFLAAQIADGTHAAHRANAIHRDLKPDNTFLLQDNRVKVLDFGIAKVVDAAKWTTQKDMVLGTILYMSPEQLQARPLTARTDIYSLGITMYEALLGRHPVHLLIESGADSSSLWDVSRVVVSKMPPMLNQLNPGIPLYVASLVNRSITKLPEQRFGSMSEFADEIRKCLERYVGEVRGRAEPLKLRDLSRHEKPSSGVERLAAFGSSDVTPAVFSPIADLPQTVAVSSAALPEAAFDTVSASEKPTLYSSAAASSPAPPRVSSVVRTASFGPLPIPAPAALAQSSASEAQRFQAPSAIPQAPPNVTSPTATPSPALSSPSIPGVTPITAQRVLLAGTLVGLLLGGVGALLYFPSHKGAREPAVAPPIAPLVNAEQAPPAQNLPTEPSPLQLPSPAGTALEVPTEPAPSPSLAVAPPSIAPAPSALEPNVAPAVTPPSPLPRPAASTRRATPASKKSVDRMEERLRRVESDLGVGPSSGL